MNFSFLLDQKLRKLDPECDNLVEKISKTILECVDKFAPLTAVKRRQQHNSNDWITNEIRNAITKKDKLFHQWVQSPNEINRDLYKRQRNIVTSLIRNAKRDCNYKKLGNSPSSTTIYRTLKYQLAKDEPKNNIPASKNFMNISHPSEESYQKNPEYDSPVNVPNFENTMVLAYCD